MAKLARLEPRYMVLDFLNYDKLDMRQCPNTAASRQLPPSLQVIVNRYICHQCREFIQMITQDVPRHLVLPLLKQALSARSELAVVTIISHWPYETLSFRDVLGAEMSDSELWEIFDCSMTTDIYLFKALIKLSPTSLLSCIDLRGFKLNDTFMTMINVWPMLSLPKRQRNGRHLVNHFLRKTHLPRSKHSLEQMVRSLENVMHRFPHNDELCFPFPRGFKLVVKLDYLVCNCHNQLLMMFLWSSFLTDITRLTVQPTSIVVQCDFSCNQESLIHSKKFELLHLLSPKKLDGIVLENIEEDNNFSSNCSRLTHFSGLRALGLPNCNIHLHYGTTRNGARTRNQFTQFLSNFHHLTRLDLSRAYIARCLGDILNALPNPLQYLGLRGCAIMEEDVTALAHSHHATVLRHLDLSQTCWQFIPIEWAGHMGDPDDIVNLKTLDLIKQLQGMKQLNVLVLCDNQVDDEFVPHLVEYLRAGKWPHLKVLDVTDNLVSVDSSLDLIRACRSSSLPEFHHLSISYDRVAVDNGGGREAFWGRILEAVRSEMFNTHMTIDLTPYEDIANVL